MTFINKINIPLLIVVIFLVKVMIFPATFPDTIIMIVLSLIYGIHKYCITRSEVLSENQFRKQMIDEISLLKSNASAINMKLDGGNALRGIAKFK